MRLYWCAFAARILLAQANWPAQLETDVHSENWSAAARVGVALISEIENGRLFTRFADVAEEVKARRLYAAALERTGDPAEARRQRYIATLLTEHRDAPEIAAETARRLANLKAAVLATQSDSSQKFPRHAANRALVVAFWASWCAPCKPELEQLAHYEHPRAEIVTFDVDRLDPSLREFVRLDSLRPELPQLYIVDPTGQNRFRLTGYQDDDFSPGNWTG